MQFLLHLWFSTRLEVHYEGSLGLTHLVDVNASEDPPGYRHPPYQGG